MNRKRILFVDDEHDLLQGVRDALRRQRKVWDMHFVTSGQEALALLKTQSFHLMVSDMRMPGMDGAELLTAVAKCYPAMSRIVLTGQATRGQLTRASGLAQQILSKPCDAATLQATIEGLLTAQASANDERVQRLVGRVTSLPSIRWVHQELLAAASSPHFDTGQFAAILETDPGLTVRVLRLSNSACFGGHERLHSVAAAVSYLGMEQVIALVIAAQTFQLLDRKPDDHPFDAVAWQRQAMRLAELARHLCPDPGHAEDAYIAGLLHSVGKVVFMLACPEPFAQALRLVDQEGITESEAEGRAIGVFQEDVGAHLLSCWAFDPAIIAAVAQQHQATPDTSAADLPSAHPHAVVRATRSANRILEGLRGQPDNATDLREWLLGQEGLPQMEPIKFDRLVDLLVRHRSDGDTR
jgi:HD-like signal output (HDOD) protein/CheY-like chemotaxis protein